MTQSPAPRTGMVLAAGLGTRMRPITDRIPKALVTLHGRTLLDHAIDRLEAAGVEHVVVNAHYKADQVVAHLSDRRSPRIEISREDALLETGGGVRQALPLLGERFYVVNSDVFWLDGKVAALRRLARAWDDETCDALLLLQRTTTPAMLSFFSSGRPAPSAMTLSATISSTRWGCRGCAASAKSRPSSSPESRSCIAASSPAPMRSRPSSR